jgi:hypothetical protein
MRIKNARMFPTATTIGTQPPQRPFLTIVIKGTFVLEANSGPARAARAQLPILVGDQPYDQDAPGGLLKFEHDLAPFKPRADIVLVGNAYPLSTQPAVACDVLIRVGHKAKTLRVIGERKWSCAADALPAMVGPRPFDCMPLTYDRAFGGSDDHAKVTSTMNPLGRGFIAQPKLESIHGKDLPNIEDPAHMIRSWDSHPVPVGCGFVPRSSLGRGRYLGTYDDAWQKTRAPHPPDDFRFEFFNGAHPDLQVDRYLAGNEPVTLNHVVRGGQRIDLFLPCLRPLITVQSAPQDGRTPGSLGIARNVPAQLDTLVFVPDDALFYVVWRGVYPLERPEAVAEVEQIGIEYEKLPLGAVA